MQKTALITGAAQGIGRACALEFARRGYWVAIHCHTHREEAAQLRNTIRAMGGYAVVVQGDVADPTQVQRFCAEAIAALGHLDVLVTNAGIALRALLQDTTPDAFDRLFAVNCRGTFLCARAVLPHMLSRKQGRIVTVSSIWGVCGASMEVAYSASKAAIIGFTKALAQEIGPSGITVNCVAPGVIDTAMNASLDDADKQALAEQTPLGRLGSPEEVAAAVCFLSSDEASFLTAQVLSPNGGLVV